MLPQVDVINLEAVIWHIRYEVHYRRPGDGAALRQSAEAHCGGIPGQCLHLGRIRHIVPGHILDYGVLGHSAPVERHLYHSRGKIHLGEHRLKFLRSQDGLDFCAARILSYGTYRNATAAEAAHVICEICRRASQLGAARQQIEQDLTYSDYRPFSFAHSFLF